MNPSVLIIGSGFGGIAAAVELKKAGIEDIVVLEQADDVGGVWRDNTYPGAACDVPSSLYSFSFEPNPAWPRRYAPQPQILSYLRHVAERYGVRPHVRLGARVVRCTWSEATQCWEVELASGETLRADVLVPAVGQLSRPALPQIPGIATFGGAAFHSAAWDHSIDLSGKNVAVIGTGASAIQFVPAIQPMVGSMTIFQRTAPYVLPRWDSAYGERHQTLFARFPITQRSERLGWFGYLEVGTVGYLYAPIIARAMTAVARRHMRRQTAGKPGLFELIWPDYPMGCKRTLLSDDYLPALTACNVTLTTAPIEAIEPDAILCTDGIRYPADVIIYGTGFETTEPLAHLNITGASGLLLSKAWADGARAYGGLAVPGFPNMLLMYGPNTNTGAGSIVHFLETQARYVRDYVRNLAATGRALDILPEVESAWDAALQGRLRRSVWTMCTSWYQSASGRVTANWPGTASEYRLRVRFRPLDYQPTGRAMPDAQP